MDGLDGRRGGRWTGRTAVVTGAASGIGRALAGRFAGVGMNVVLADVDRSGLDDARHVLADQGHEVVAVPTDVTEEASVVALARRCIESFGAVHVLCNNAGVGVNGLTWEVPRREWEWVMDVNLWGTVNGLRAFLPFLFDQDEGHVVNTASMAAFAGGFGSSPYTASKYAVVGLSECLHHELREQGRNVHVTVLCPGVVRTRIADAGRNWPAERGPAPRRKVLENRMLPDVVWRMLEDPLDPDEVAGMVVDAMEERRFWVLTHREIEGLAIERAAGIASGVLPPLELRAR